jgi:hypothetical protein
MAQQPHAIGSTTLKHMNDDMINAIIGGLFGGIHTDLQNDSSTIREAENHLD